MATINNVCIHIKFCYLIQCNLYNYIIHTNLFQLIEMCNHIRVRWNYKKLTFASEELDVLESSYNKYHTYLALALHNAVQNKDANYCKSEILLTTLYNSFQIDIPKIDTIVLISKDKI